MMDANGYKSLVTIKKGRYVGRFTRPTSMLHEVVCPPRVVARGNRAPSGALVLHGCTHILPYLQQGKSGEGARELGLHHWPALWCAI